MQDTATTHTGDYLLRESQLECRQLRHDLAQAHEKNIDVAHRLREVLKTRWYRLGKMLGMVP